MSLIYKIEKKAINGFLWSWTSRLEVQSTAKAISTSISVGVTSISVRAGGGNEWTDFFSIRETASSSKQKNAIF